MLLCRRAPVLPVLPTLPAPVLPAPHAAATRLPTRGRSCGSSRWLDCCCRMQTGAGVPKSWEQGGGWAARLRRERCQGPGCAGGEPLPFQPPGEPLLFGGDTDGFSSLPAPHLLGEAPRCCRGLSGASRDLRWHGHRALLTGTRELRGDGADTAPWLPGPVRGSSWTTKAWYRMEILIACNGRWGVMPGRFGAGGDG